MSYSRVNDVNKGMFSMKKEKYMVLGVPLDHIRNSNEIRVAKAINEAIEEFPDFDKCSLCIEDVYALTLSRLPPCYVQPGSIVLHQTVESSEIEEMVRYAIRQVMEHPNHPKH